MTFDELKAGILNCRECEALFGFEPHPVFQGRPDSKIMQISQAPSRNVHNTGKPFDDASGRKLRGEWYGIPDGVFYNPENFYIASVARCYPGKSPSGGDRPPPKACARLWLEKEMELVDNEIYLLVGGIAARRFFPGRDFSALVFHNQTLRGKPAYVLPHPSPLNVKWFMDHPDFFSARIWQVREAVHRALGL